MSETTSEALESKKKAPPPHGSHAPHGHGEDVFGHDEHAGHGHYPFLQHHFDTPQQQFDAGKMGIWLFLVTEVLFFAGLFCAYTVYRAQHPEIFVWAHYYLDTNLGAVNTVVLLGSSLTAAWAVRCAQLKQKQGLILNIVITIACACAFMCIKYVEYSHKFHDGLTWPGRAEKPLFGVRFNPTHEVWELDSFKKKHPEAAELAHKLREQSKNKGAEGATAASPAGAGTAAPGEAPAAPAAAGATNAQAPSGAEAQANPAAASAAAPADPKAPTADQAAAAPGAALAEAKEENAQEKQAAKQDDKATGTAAGQATPPTSQPQGVKPTEPAPAGSSAAAPSGAPGGTQAVAPSATANVTMPVPQSPELAGGQGTVGDSQADMPAPMKLGQHAWPLRQAGILSPSGELLQYPKNAHVFFSIYFFMTGLHGIHVVIGIIVWIWMLTKAVKGVFGENYFGPIDYSALYWHLVDLVWIYLFPLLYLIH